MGVLSLDRDRLYTGSKLGQSIEAKFTAELDALSADNRKLESALAQEESDLTALRATLASDEFQKRAQEFDTKVEGLRQAQDAKSRDITARRDAARMAFFEQARPALERLMAERGAGAILDRSVVVLGFDAIDVTDRAINVLDAAFDGKPYPELPRAEPPEAEQPQPVAADPAPQVQPDIGPPEQPAADAATAEPAAPLSPPAQPTIRPQPRPESPPAPQP